MSGLVNVNSAVVVDVLIGLSQMALSVAGVAPQPIVPAGERMQATEDLRFAQAIVTAAN